MRNIIFCLSLMTVVSATAGYKVQIRKQGHKNQIISIQETQNSPNKILRHIPYFLEEGVPPSSLIYEERIISKAELPANFRQYINKITSLTVDGSEVRILTEQGPKENRVNLTILGDGYTMAQKDKFFIDANRTLKGLFTGSTFKSYLPLFNVYAVFMPSNQSGIGDGSPIDTAFQLYRTPKGSKRAIYPGNQSALEEALSLAPATDFPIVIANDEFYGGLGGRYAISTSSELSGLVVLRHELGHNFGEVGEEYDNGAIYTGANSSSGTNVSWKHWIPGNLKINESRIVSGDYVWQNLSESDYKTDFTTNFFPGGFFFGMISSVGWETPNDVVAMLDNSPLDLKGTFNSDRNFYEIKPVKDFPTGKHTFSVSEKVKDGNNVLGFAELFVAPPDYDFTENAIGAYSTFDQNGRKSYRPTHSSCLMREMSVDYFCAVDKENIWYKLLNRVSLIDDIKVTTAPGSKNIELKTIGLSGLHIQWFKFVGSQISEVKNLEDKMQWSSTETNVKYRVVVSFKTDEVVKYNPSFTASKDFQF